MKPRRLEKINSLLRNLAADFLAKNSDNSIITINYIETSRDLKTAKIFISIFPESKEAETMEILKLKTGELRKFIGSRIKMKFLPHLEFAIDKGEKKRQKIEEILRNGTVAKW